MCGAAAGTNKRSRLCTAGLTQERSADRFCVTPSTQKAGMSAILILTAVLLLASVLLAAVALVRAVAGGRQLRDPHGLGRQRAGILAGVALAGLAWPVGEHHELVLALAPLAGSCWVLGLIVAERGRKGVPLGPLRVAGLGPRTADGLISRHALAGMRFTFVLTAGLAVLAIALASDSDARMFQASCSEVMTSRHGPWPGAPYAVPALVALALGWTLAEWAIRTVARRPPEAADERADRGRRVLAARTAVTAAVLMALPTLAGLLISMGGAVHGACPTAAENALSVGMLGVGALLWLASAAAWVAALLSGGRSVVSRVPA